MCHPGQAGAYTIAQAGLDPVVLPSLSNSCVFRPVIPGLLRQTLKCLTLMTSLKERLYLPHLRVKEIYEPGCITIRSQGQGQLNLRSILWPLPPLPMVDPHLVSPKGVKRISFKQWPSNKSLYQDSLLSRLSDPLPDIGSDSEAWVSRWRWCRFLETTLRNSGWEQDS